ncbi:vWA domain-containing protein [Neorhodopirellula pilleata]|uniref:VWFA domain-containing protein n=1 Tax=Neorhodopirellula pilleata TaxID=2714738 RepID=A0A5C6AU81_9BACT|nr:vWA domain-containing protein [Neorhodopirellula pilleata]TWU03300.1 hypothetical protein Pla100_02180 [Neorhodopirellula pilleata]
MGIFTSPLKTGGVVLLVIFGLVWHPRGMVSADEPISVVGNAIESMFSPLAAPKRKTMGLLQRNFLDMAGQSAELEVAIVVDGTDSMAGELQGIRESLLRMIGDLRRLRSGQVRVAIVVYRDFDSPASEVEMLLPAFSADDAEIQSAIDSLQPQQGAPFYYEMVDIGVHRAVTKLNWSDDPTVSKWIILFGDAPPYPSDFSDKELPDAKRYFADEVLVSLASSRGIQIHCILCKSTEETSEPHLESIGSTRRMMDRLSTETGGMVLDLSYPVIREAFTKKSQPPPTQYTPVQPITLRDLAADRKSRPQSSSMMIAVLPHEPVSQISFDPERPAAQVATALVNKLRQLSGVRIKNPLDVERQLRRMRAEGLDEMEAIRGLAARLRVDYVVWGRLQDETTMRTVAFRQRDGLPVIQVSHRGSPDGLAKVVLQAAARSPGSDPDFARFASEVLESAQSSILQTPIAGNASTTSAVLTAIGSLEQSLGEAIGSDQSQRWLDRAEAAAKQAIEQEPDNGLAHWVLANVSFNQASALFRDQIEDRATEAMKDCKSALRLAYNQRDKIGSQPLALEVEADFRLLARRETDQAITLYEKMTDPEMPSDTQRRGHWMLSGLYAGDWGVAEEVVDAKLARQHTVAILAGWPDSPEAEQLRQWLQWDETRDETRHNYLPKLNEALPGLDQ